MIDATAAIQAHQILSGPGHNLAGHGLADSYLGRGDILQHFGLPADDKSLIRAALADFGEVLSLADPEEHQKIYGHGLLNLGVVLRAKGGFENLRTADEHIREACKYFKARKHEASRECAHLTWQTVMIRFELRKHPEGLEIVKERPAQLRSLLERSRDDFIEVNMPAESAAVAADLTQVLFPKRVKIIKVMDDTFCLIRDRWSSFTPEIRQAFEPVSKAMSAVRRAADQDVTVMKSTELENRMRATIERLRETTAEAAHGDLLPCLLTWSEARRRPARRRPLS